MTKKHKEADFKVQCYDCHHAVLYQWDNNPIIAFCNKFSKHEVAKSVRKCVSYKVRNNQPKIIKLTHFK